MRSIVVRFACTLLFVFGALAPGVLVFAQTTSLKVQPLGETVFDGCGCEAKDKHGKVFYTTLAGVKGENKPRMKVGEAVLTFKDKLEHGGGNFENHISFGAQKGQSFEMVLESGDIQAEVRGVLTVLTPPCGRKDGGGEQCNRTFDVRFKLLKGKEKEIQDSWIGSCGC